MLNKRLLVISISLLPLMSQATLTREGPQQEIVAAHNHYRAQHGAARLQWDSELARYAEQHAKRCVFKHSGGDYGENLAAGYPTATAAIAAWYSEVAFYSYQKPRFSSATGHFTQLVWRSTQKIGCASVACNGRQGTQGDYLVCEYSPAGNVVNPGYFAENVLPGNFD
jgi:uncharacterized protein YkwD